MIYMSLLLKTILAMFQLKLAPLYFVDVFDYLDLMGSVVQSEEPLTSSHLVYELLSFPFVLCSLEIPDLDL